MDDPLADVARQALNARRSSQRVSCDDRRKHNDYNNDRSDNQISDSRRRKGEQDIDLESGGDRHNRLRSSRSRSTSLDREDRNNDERNHHRSKHRSKHNKHTHKHKTHHRNDDHHRHHHHHHHHHNHHRHHDREEKKDSDDVNGPVIAGSRASSAVVDSAVDISLVPAEELEAQLRALEEKVVQQKKALLQIKLRTEMERA